MESRAQRALPRSSPRRVSALLVGLALAGCAHESPVEGVTKIFEFSGIRETLTAVALAPDGTLVVVGDIDGEIVARGVPSGEERWRARATGPGSKAFIGSLVFSPDGSLLVSAGDDAPAVSLWDAETGEARATFPIHGGRSLAFDPSGQTLVIAAGSTLHVVDLETDEVAKSIPDAHGGEEVYAAAFSPAGDFLVTASQRGRLTVWEWPAFVKRASTPVSESLEPMTPWSLAVSGHGPRVAVNGIEGEGVVWDAGRDRIARKFASTPPGPGRVPRAEMRRSLAFTQDGEWLFAPESGDKGIRLLHATSRTSQAVVQGEAPYCTAVALALPAKMIALLHPFNWEGRGPYGLQVWKLRFRGEPAVVPAAQAVEVPSDSPAEARARLQALGIPVDEASLFARIRAKDEVTVRLLLRAEVSPNAVDSTGHTPATLAVEVNAPPVLRALVEAPADLNRRGSNGSPPILLAAEQGRIECARVLLEARTQIGEESDRGHPVNIVTPSVDRNGRDARNRTAILAAVVGRQPEMVRFLLDEGFDPTPGGEDGETPLLAAIAQNDLGLLRLLLQKGANEEVPDSRGRTPLMRACILGRLEMVEALVLAGADCSKWDHEGKTALGLAQEAEWTAIAAYLAERGAPAAPRAVPPHPGRRARRSS